MNKTLFLFLVLSFPIASMASMNVIRENSGKVISVNPWSYLDEEVMWASVYSSNPDGGKINGYIKAKYATEFSYIKNHTHHVNDNITFAQGVFRSHDLPGWYLGFSSNRNANYSGPYGRYEYQNSTFNTEVVVGKEFRYDNIRFGAEVMGGYQSSGFSDDQGKIGYWNARLKLFTDIQIDDHFSIFGYVYQQFDRKRIRNDENDRDSRSTVIEPGIQYIINNNNGVWIRTHASFARLEREKWGNIKDKDNVTSIGYWNIWDRLQTSISTGIGKYKKYNSQNSEIFYNRNYNYVQLNATYPITDRFTLYGEVKRMHLNEIGNWSTNSKGNIYNYKAMIDFNF